MSPRMSPEELQAALERVAARRRTQDEVLASLRDGTLPLADVLDRAARDPDVGGIKTTTLLGSMGYGLMESRVLMSKIGLEVTNPRISRLTDKQRAGLLQTPWRQSEPMRPDRIESVFQSGLQWMLEISDSVAVTDLATAGTVRMPSGRLIATDPTLLHSQPEPFETRIEPGDYEVELAILRFADDPQHGLVAAAKLVVSTEPVASWELALTAGQDVRQLGHDQFYGFGVDGGMGCFVDADALATFKEVIGSTSDALSKVSGATAVQLSAPDSVATLVAFQSGVGDGSYPTWLGRTATGEVACFVADMLVLRNETMVGDDA